MGHAKASFYCFSHFVCKQCKHFGVLISFLRQEFKWKGHYSLSFQISICNNYVSNNIETYSQSH